MFFVAAPQAIGAVPWTFMAVVSLLGIVTCAQTLARKSARTKLVKTRTLKRFDGGVDVCINHLQTFRNFTHAQFATIACNRARAEAHPLTIAGGGSTTRRFL